MTTEYLFSPPAVSSADVEGRDEKFPIRRIICVGRNYRAHAEEMGFDPDREPPFFFMKPADTIEPDGAVIPYPMMTENLHYEMELVVAIGEGGVNISAEDANNHIYGYAAGVDLTRRDLQLHARERGRPWDWGKGFDQSAPCGAIVEASKIGHPDTGRIWLKVNGETKQDSDIKELIWAVPDIVAFASASMELKPGDLIFTGTPAGVGAVVAGDKIEGGIDGIGEITIEIAQPKS